MRRSRFTPVYLLPILLVLAAPTPAGAQARPPSGPGFPTAGIGSIVIRVRDSVGVPLAGHASVTLSSAVGSTYLTSSTGENGEATFRGLTIGSYTVEVSAPGYQRSVSEVSHLTPDSATLVVIELRRAAPEGHEAGAAVPPLLAPRARKEIDEGLAALRKEDYKEAEARLNRALKLAPGHPDVHFLLGLLRMKQLDLPAARAHLEKAVEIYPKHVQALNALGTLLTHLKEDGEAIRILEQAVAEGSSSWETHWTLANACFRQKDYEKARRHADRTMDLSQGKMPAAGLLLARSLAAQGRRDEALRRVRNFLLRYSDHPLAPEARELENSLRNKKEGEKVVPGSPSVPPEPAPALPGRV